ncbi:MAG: phosphoribosylformylglycinamidine synthase subunit PurS [Candidatus Muirbacterium halophilum]|nr:phosphoribosylformylglycinamidine synthase subunit PurS [Candidatus Muirbacterium halophilum]MCK9474927.1 phosphoribosylformylglycinamidine synthase subunit PurS [Candidatus Muirbacterium halophilum]
MIKVRVYVEHKKGIVDPQGKAIKLGLENLGFLDIANVLTGKTIDVDFKHDNTQKALEDTKNMCEKMLSNPNMENYRIEKIN